jgi:hypothetical protein
MPEESLPDDIRLLLSRHLSSVDHVSVTSALAANNGTAVSVRELASSANLSESAAGVALRDLVASGLATESETGFRIPPEHAELGAARKLADVYNQNPIAVIKAIYDRPVSSAMSFAEAFRIRRNVE